MADQCPYVYRDRVIHWYDLLIVLLGLVLIMAQSTCREFLEFDLVLLTPVNHLKDERVTVA